MEYITNFQKRNLVIVIILSLLAGGMSGMFFSAFGGSILNRINLAAGGVASKESSNVSQIGQKALDVVDEQSAVVDLVEAANPAVVNIVISKDVSQYYKSLDSDVFLFDDFFKFGFPFELEFPEGRIKPDDENQNDGEVELQRIGGGSGFIIEGDGLIVTNKHVVSDEDAVYTVVLSTGEEYEAEVVARDSLIDVALIKIKAEGLPTLKLGDSESLKIGQTVVAIGYALAEYGNTVTRGVVSGMGRRVVAGTGSGMSEVLDEAIQTDAAINPGNSGGPLLNLQGHVVGINTAVSSKGQLVGFAIPINIAKRTIESVRVNGRIIRPWLGVRYMPVTPRLAEVNNLSVTYGALITRGETNEELAVIPGSPADKAGLVENDIILEVNGVKLEEKNSLAKEVAKYGVDEEITLKIQHKGSEKHVKIKLEEFSDD